ncbi:MAG: hypothetical protein COB66_09540 [Coxiella sp. (in: Bacteria)]|nr:MAG: hypothetical protein COB66_09540 [Coxiella sp. (in: g-proteobacteria)]
MTRKLLKPLFGVSLSMVLSAGIAGGSTSLTQMPTAPMPKFNFFMPQQSVLPHPVHHRFHHYYRRHSSVRLHYVNIYPGSLKTNIVRLSRAYGWKHIIWQSQDDYHWIGKVRVAANNLPDILKKILSDYPLQANFYAGNHVLVITPRTIQT